MTLSILSVEGTEPTKSISHDDYTKNNSSPLNAQDLADPGTARSDTDRYCRHSGDSRTGGCKLSGHKKVRLNENLFLSKYDGAHYYLIGISGTNALSKINFFSKFQWYEVFDIRECQHHNIYLGAGAKILERNCLVHPQYLGAHYYRIGISRKVDLSKKNFFSMFQWHEVFDNRECQHYNIWLGTGAKIFEKNCLVRPQYLGSHYYRIGISRICALSKIIFFSEFIWYEFVDIRECQHCNSNLRAGAKISAKYCRVRAQYLGAHHYLIDRSRLYAWSKTKKIFKILWFKLNDGKECHHCNSYLGASAKFFAKFCLVRPQYLGAHYYLIGINWIYALSEEVFFSKYLWYNFLQTLLGYILSMFLKKGYPSVGSERFCKIKLKKLKNLLKNTTQRLTLENFHIHNSKVIQRYTQRYCLQKSLNNNLGFVIRIKKQFMGIFIYLLFSKLTMSVDDIEMADLLAGQWCGFPSQPPHLQGPPQPPDQQGGHQTPITMQPPRSPPLPGPGQVNPRGISIEQNVNCTDSVQSTSRYTCDNDINIMGTDSTYMQCKAARTLGMAHNTLDCNMTEDTGTCKIVQHERIGSLAIQGDTLLEKTFRGSRIATGEKVVNQNVTLSFDPLTMICTCCSKPHSVVPCDGSGLVVVVADQNFVSCVVGREFCIPVIRVEDAALIELADFTQEVLGRTPLPAGTLFLVGSVSHLVQMGSTLYAQDWQRVVAKFTDRWQNCKVGPLPPILREDSPGSTGRCLVEIRHWFASIYTLSNSIVFNNTAWDIVIKGITAGTYPTQDLDHVEFHTIPLPLSLSDRTLHPLKLMRSSSQAITPGLDGEATHELLLALLHTLCGLFGCRANPEDLILARAPAECESTKDTSSTPSTLIFIGASHLKRTVSHLGNHGFNIIDLTHPGWTLNEQNIKRALDDIGMLGDVNNAVCILDIVSNTAYRFENREDGSLSLPYKISGQYHMDGRVTTCSLETLHTLLIKAGPILDSLPGLKICIPPIPRYLRTPCCDTEGHCEGIADSEHAVELMSKTLTLKRQMKDFMLTKGFSNSFVPDTVKLLFPDAKTTVELTDGILGITHSDGVHLVDEGYVALGSILLKVVADRTAVKNALAGKTDAGKSFYWRGFTSPVGSARPKTSSCSYKESHPGGGKWREPPNRFYSHQSSARGRGKPYGPPPGGKRWY